MHIPDGYLSPSSCAVLYAGAAPVWYTALNRVKKTLNARMIPMLSLFAAFSFVIMMFNLPLPGGTTGHAVGMGIAAIILGPWASILAISIATATQAVFFGDGGITAIGANCFNMAIVGSTVAYGVYRLLARGAAITSRRRALAAGIAGYAAINVSALCAAIEFGIQPMLFQDASGAPLYAPYPLSVSIPAMMIGHLTIAGLAEFVISAGLVAYLQRTDTALLRLTAPDAAALDLPARKLWVGLAALLVLTPLGILAVGTAWGEWSARDLSSAPEGLARLNSIWTAPIARYAPSFIRSASFGYFLSAILGVGLVIVASFALSALLSKTRRRRRSFIEKTTRHLLNAVQRSLFAEETALANGLLQRLDARVKLIGIAALIVAAISVHRIWAIAAILLLGVLLALLSRISIGTLIKRVWIAVLGFTGVIALPAVFLTPGQVVYRLPILGGAATHQGLNSALLLILRAETAATLSTLLILCAPWARVLRALRFFRVPTVLVVILGMTYRYIFLFLQTAQDMFESRQTRLVGVLEPADRRRLAAASAGVLLEKSLQLSGEVLTAMQARGFRGEVYLLDDLTMGGKDWAQLAAFLCAASIAIWLGRF